MKAYKRFPGIFRLWKLAQNIGSTLFPPQKIFINIRERIDSKRSFKFKQFKFPYNSFICAQFIQVSFMLYYKSKPIAIVVSDSSQWLIPRNQLGDLLFFFKGAPLPIFRASSINSRFSWIVSLLFENKKTNFTLFTSGQDSVLNHH